MITSMVRRMRDGELVPVAMYDLGMTQGGLCYTSVWLVDGQTFRVQTLRSAAPTAVARFAMDEMVLQAVGYDITDVCAYMACWP